MQHWTLCEILRIAQFNDVTQLNYIDAHAMAPLAKQRAPQKVHQGSGVFTRAQTRLPGQESTYENAWHVLAPTASCGYPSSANFVQHIWRSNLSMLLCEQDAGIMEEIEAWRITRLDGQRRSLCEVHCGDWRERFGKGLPHLQSIGQSEKALTFLSFDPNKYSTDGQPGEDDFDLYPLDLEYLVESLSSLEGSVLIQLSTYDRGRQNQYPQQEVIQSVNGILGQLADYTPSVVLRADGNMMSLICTRKVRWWGELSELPPRFNKWLRQC